MTCELDELTETVSTRHLQAPEVLIGELHTYSSASDMWCLGHIFTYISTRVNPNLLTPSEKELFQEIGKRCHTQEPLERPCALDILNELNLFIEHQQQQEASSSMQAVPPLQRSNVVYVASLTSKRGKMHQRRECYGATLLLDEACAVTQGRLRCSHCFN